MRPSECQSTVRLKDTKNQLLLGRSSWMQENNTSIAQVLNVDHAKHIQENWHYLTAILKYVLLCCRWHDIAFRGHREDLTNSNANPGNILAVFGNCQNMITLCLLDCWAWIVWVARIHLVQSTHRNQFRMS